MMKVRDFLPNHQDGECEVVEVRYLEWDGKLSEDFVYLSFDFKVSFPEEHSDPIGTYGMFFPNETIFVAGEKPA